MDIEQLLSIVTDDDLGILKVKPKPTPGSTEEERLVSSFEEIQKFVQEHSHEPHAVMTDMNEFKLHKRLEGLRADPIKSEVLKDYDEYGLLSVIKVLDSVEDIFSDDAFGILDDGEESIFTLNNVPKITTMPDDVARRQKCEDFEDFEHLFIECHGDLKNGTRKPIPFAKEQQIQKGLFFILKGMLLYVAEKGDVIKQKGKSNARLRCVFENGTESRMLLRSLASELYKDGRRISTHEDRLLDNFEGVTDEDQSSGYIYILRSLSKEQEIKDIPNLFKIGHSRVSVEERIKNAENEATYLMAPVQIISSFQCYNLNTQKLEGLLHSFFGSSCLDVDVVDNDGKRHKPREWFIAPIEAIEVAVKMIINGDIVNYRYDSDAQEIVGKDA